MPFWGKMQCQFSKLGNVQSPLLFVHVSGEEQKGWRHDKEPQDKAEVNGNSSASLTAVQQGHNYPNGNQCTLEQH